MHLVSIHLENYRKYRDQTVEFPAGIVGIVGKNGVGKSTLIEAIGWCLYGSNAARTTQDQIRTTGAAGRNCCVTLEFILGSDAIRVVRELRGDDALPRASVFLNGSSDAHVSGTSEVTNFVTGRMGMDRVAFFASVFAQQKELDAFSDLRPGERKKIITRLLRIDRIDTAITVIRTDIRDLKRTIEMLEENLKDMDELEAKQKKAEDEERDAANQLVECGKRISGLKMDEDKAKNDFDAHDAKHRLHVEEDKALAGLVEKIRSGGDEKGRIETEWQEAISAREELQRMQPQLDEYGTVKKRKEELDIASGRFGAKKSLEGQLSSLRSRIRELEQSRQEAEDRLPGLQDTGSRLQEQEEELNMAQTRVEELAGMISGISARTEEAQEQKRQYGAKLADIQKLGRDGDCPTCKRPLQDYLPTVTKQIADAISDLEKEILMKGDEKERFTRLHGEAKDDVQKISEMIGHTRTAISELDSLQQQLEHSKKERESSEETVSGLITELGKLDDLGYDPNLHHNIKLRYAELQKIKNRSIKLDEQVRKIPKLERDLRERLDANLQLEKKREEIQKTITSIGYDQAAHQKSRQVLEKVTERLSSAKGEYGRLQGVVNTAKAKLEQIKDEIREEEKKVVRIGEKKRSAELRTRLTEVMEGFKLDLISRIRPLLSDRTSEMLGQITDGRYPRVELDENYDMRVEDNGEIFSTERFSGGETDLANLCLRVAISMELAERSGGEQISFIALDEIFGSQDEERKRSILDALQTLSGRFRQILLITLAENVKDALPYVLAVRENPDGLAAITVEG